jgi:ATP/maltotriose-dependent transcriptional regulator MalT
MAGAIPGARFVPLEGHNHILLADEPAWGTMLAEVHGFLGVEATPPAPAAWGLSGREQQILGLVAQGLSNEEIAADLVLSVRTVERHLANVYGKLRLSGRSARAAAAARYAQETARPA